MARPAKGYRKASPVYDTWKQMRQRCQNPNHLAYKNYGGRGIIVCATWDKFDAFHEWAMSNGWQPERQLDRINNDGPYSPDNCRFTTRRENNQNRRNNFRVSAWGETKSLTAWVDDPRMITTYSRAYYRLSKAGWKPETALGTV